MDQDLEKQKRKDERKKILSTWNAALKNGLLYNENHPNLEQACQTLCANLTIAFQQMLDLNIVNQDGVFIIENDLYIEESITFYDLIHLLEELRIKTVQFISGVTPEEIRAFIAFLLTHYKDKTKQADPHASFQNPHIRLVLINDDDDAFKTRRSKKGRIEKIERFRLEILDKSGKIMGKILEEQSFQAGELTILFDEIIDLIHLDPYTFARLGSIQKDQLHLEHSIQSVFYSIFIAQQLGLDLSTIRSLAMAAFLHDIGRWFLPSEFKTGYKLTAGDHNFIELHAVDGAAFLANIPGIPIIFIRVAMEHHIGFDGLGYPDLPSSLKPHIFSQIIGLADFASWATISGNYYHQPIPPHRLMRVLLRRAGSQFHPLLVKLFLPMFGLYPSGSKLVLQSGEKAVSLEPNIRNILRPTVAMKDENNKLVFTSLTEFSKNNPARFEREVRTQVGWENNVDDLIKNSD